MSTFPTHRHLPTPPPAGCRVLVVDDSPDIREVLIYLLQQTGYAVMTAADGAEALELLATDAYDAVLSDVSMPVMGGCELLSRLRADPALQALPVILMTAWAEGAAGRCGEADELILKPFTSADLLGALHRVNCHPSASRRPN